MGFSHKTDEQRFWESVDKSAGPAGCWIWTGAKDTSGYGQMRINSKPVLMHRYSWILAIGSIAEGMCVLHRCDVRNCVNPHHLFLGDRFANNQDSYQKTQYVSRRGEKHCFAKLTEQQVKEILLALKTKTEKDLAIEYKVSARTINAIANKRVWKHIPR